MTEAFWEDEEPGTDPTFVEAVRILVEEARPLITDGAAEGVSVEDLARAERALAGSTEAADIESLAQVAALGVEYLTAVGRERTAVYQVGPTPERAVGSIRYMSANGGLV